MKSINQCLTGILFIPVDSTTGRAAWELIVPKLFTHHHDFEQVIGHVIDRQTALIHKSRSSAQKLDTSFAIILDGITMKEVGISTRKLEMMRNLDIVVESHKPSDFKGKIFSQHAWELSDMYSHHETRGKKRYLPVDGLDLIRISI